jgi:ATP-dependent protease ClpP protease subunit
MSAFKPKSNDGKRLSKPSTKQSNELLLGEEVVEFLPTPELFNLYKLNGYDPHIRAIFINDDINEDTAYHFISSVNTILKYENTTEPIKLFVNSYGGDVYDMFWIIDTMNTLAKNGILVDTIGCGKIMSAGAFITISGTGKRYVYPNTSIMYYKIVEVELEIPFVPK